MPHPIDRYISEGEHQQQDFKFRIDDARKIARSLAAFANTDGGRLLVGVKDNGKITGIATDEEYHVLETAAQLFTKPEVRFETQAWEVRGKIVLEVTIPRSEERPHKVKNEDGRWLAYLRKADQNLLANAVLLKVWKQKDGMKDAKVTYTEPERFLLSYLREHDSITFSRFYKLSKIDRKQAENILVQLVCWNVIEMDFSEKGCVYRLNPKFDTATSNQP